jgi:hypothetical protein
VSFATDGDTEDLGPLVGRRPISVAALLEREGYRPAVRSRATKRALSGVAAGAVLALGAVVGSLLLNHGTTTTGDTLASGSQSGGDIVLAESGAPFGTTHAGASQSGTVTTTRSGTSSATSRPTTKPGAPQVSQNGTRNTGSTSHHTDDSVATGRGYTGYTGTNSTTSGAANITATDPATPDAPTSTGAAPTTTTTTTPPSTTTDTAPPSNSTSTTPPATTDTTPPGTTTPPPSTTTSGGGLLGAVTGTLDNVTAPVFNWFG